MLPSTLCEGEFSIVSALVTSCDKVCSFVWLPRFVSDVNCELSCDFTKDVVLNYLFYLVPFYYTCLSNCKLLISSIVVFHSITHQTVMSNPSFWYSDIAYIALEEECEGIVGAQPVGQEWQPNDVI